MRAVGLAVFDYESVREFAVFVHVDELVRVVHRVDDGDGGVLVPEDVAAGFEPFDLVAQLAQ